ncbi:uncharacterized protein LOC101851234 [Aplysia californica]|uniref:Uncharacterized protein LOC101851234 n=1 Tax=Aplysia californica TaxID=6500 RepID=A0ABM0JAW2_APLCA|nr:uncharacterized protein LOC101851234 [Aplysia californica]
MKCSTREEHPMPKELTSVESSKALESSGRFLPRLSPEEKDLDASQSSQLLQSLRRPAPGSSSKLSASFAEMVGLQDNEKRMDRKAMARRQLLGGLKPSVSQDHGLGRGVRRTQSLNYGPHAGNNISNGGGPRTGPSEHGKISSPSPEQPSKRQLRRTGSLRHTTVSDRETRDTIQNWNELVHELNASHHFPSRDTQGHLEIVSDSSESPSTLTPVNIIKPKVVTFNNNGILRQQKQNKKTAISAVHNVFPSGIGITKYRPITPNLLHSLDKKRQPSKRRTQQWLNQIEVNRRAQMTVSLRDEPNRALSKSTRVDNPDSASPPLGSTSGNISKPGYGFL